MSRSEAKVEYLRHIRQEAAYLADLGHDVEKERFLKDEMLK